MCWGWSESLQLPGYHYDFPSNLPSLNFSDECQCHKNIVAEKPLKYASSRHSGLLCVPLSASLCVQQLSTLHHNLAFSISALVHEKPLLPSVQRGSVQSKMRLTVLGWMSKDSLSCVQDRGIWIFLPSPCCCTAHRWPFGLSLLVSFPILELQHGTADGN